MRNESKNIFRIQDIENQLWQACEELRGSLSSEEYMHVVIGILFLKQISDKYEFALEKMKKNLPNSWEDHVKDFDCLAEYDCSFFVPEKARWDFINKYAGRPEIGSKIDNALRELENANPSLNNLFSKNYAREELDKQKLGQVVSIFSNTKFDCQEDLMGRIYEFFLGKFSLKQGQKGGEFYTPKCIVSLMVNLINPTGKLYDPCCGSGGMFIQAQQHMKSKNLDPDKLLIYGQEYSDKTWRMAKVNLLLHGFYIDNIKLGQKAADAFSEDQHKSLEANSALANPPFNMKKYNRDSKEKWIFGIPPKENANYAWIQLILEKLGNNGKAAIILANNSLTSTSKPEKEIRKKIIESKWISAIIMLPEKLFYTTDIPACLWIFDKGRKNKDKVLFIDAQVMGKPIDGQKKNNELTENDIKALTDIYNDFLKNKDIDVPGVAKTVRLKEIKDDDNDYSLLPTIYISEKKDTRPEKEVNEEIAKKFKNLLKLMDISEKLKIDVKKSFKKLKLKI